MAQAWMRKAVVSSSFLLIFHQVGAQAQVEDSFPPPPPGPSGELDESPESGIPGAVGSKEAAKDNGVLNKKRRGDFNKSRPEDITDDKFPETIESFDFPNADIADVIKAISELTGKNFIIDPGVRGKITIVAPSKITVAEAYKAFLSALAMNKMTVVPSGSFLKIKSSRDAQTDNIETYSGGYYPNTDQMITRIIHLKHINAEQVQRDLRILQPRDGQMSIYAPTNSIVISDYGSSIDRFMKIINQLDVPGFEEQIEVVPIKFAKAKDMAELVDKIINKGEKKASGAAGSFSAGVPRYTRGSTSGQQGNSYFMAIPDDRTNSIIVVGNAAGITRLKKLLAQLDFRLTGDGSGNVHVYYVKNGDAEKMAQVLQGVTKDAGPKSSSGSGGGSGMFPPPGGFQNQMQEIFGGDVKITADKGTNSLIITASKSDYEVVLGLLQKIDIQRDQVFVEGVIMEMTGNDGNSVSSGYYKYPPKGYGKAGFNGFQSGELLQMLSPVAGSGAILGFGSDKMVEVKDPMSTTGQTMKVPDLIAFINILKKTNKANILSTPQITTLDSQEGSIEVGDRVAVSANTSVSATGVQNTSPSFEDVTIKLVIKPIINPSSDSIRMEVNQEIKQPSPGAASAAALKDTTLTLASRKLKTVIVVNNGDTAVLGGLMKDEEREIVQKVPLLGDIPILGWLFKSTSHTKEKVNMVVFLTPKIIRSAKDSREVVARKMNERIDHVKSANGGRDPFGKKVDEIMKKMAYDGIKSDEDNRDKGDSNELPSEKN